MSEVLSDGKIVYKNGEEPQSTKTLLDNAVPILSARGWEREVKATDLSPVKPRKYVNTEEINRSNEIVRELAMSNPLNRLPEVRQSGLTFLTPML